MHRYRHRVLRRHQGGGILSHGVYGGQLGHQQHGTRAAEEKYDIWLAQYNTTVTYPVPYTIWQYTSKGAVAGIAGNIDRNIGLKDYAKIIRDGGWNHLK